MPAKAELSQVLGNATPYLEVFGYLNIAWVLLKVSTEAQGAADLDSVQKASTLKTTEYYYQYILSRIKGLHHSLTQFDLSVTQFDSAAELLV